MSHVTPVAIAVVEYDDRFLVGKRSKSVPLGGLWEFPGGKIERDESPKNAAARECLEETGVRIQVLHCMIVHLQQYSHGQIKLQFFACQPIGPPPTPHPPFEWVTREKLANLQFPDGNQPVLQCLLGN